MESFEAVVRAILARIRIHQIPRAVPSVEEVVPPEETRRSLYRTSPTTWGAAAGSGVPLSRLPHLDPGRQPAEPRLERSRRRTRGELRLPDVHEVPAPRGLLACGPRRTRSKG